MPTTEIADKDADMTEATSGIDPSADDTTADEPTDSATAEESAPGDAPRKSPRERRRVSVSVRTILVGATIVGLIAMLGSMTWLYLGAKAKFDDQNRQAADISRAEQIALDYAVNAAIMDYKDLGPWKQNLVKGTTPQLNKKLTEAGTAMEQILLPLQWTSSAKPLAAHVRSHDNGLYVVDTFVGVTTKTVQAAEGLQSTATYSITINSKDGWLISDVGGIAAVIGDK